MLGALGVVWRCLRSRAVRRMAPALIQSWTSSTVTPLVGTTARCGSDWRAAAEDQRAAFFVARLRGGVNRSAIAAMAEGTRR